MKSSRLVREIHFTLAAFVTPFVFVYILSAWVMEDPFIKLSRVHTSNERVALPEGIPRHVDSIAQFLKSERDISGRIKSRVEQGGAVDFKIRRLGMEWQISLAVDSRQIEIEERAGNLFRTLERIHQHSGIRNDDLAPDLWGLVAGAISASLIILGLTGIYFWFLVTKEPRGGLILLGCHAAITILVLSLVRLA